MKAAQRGCRAPSRRARHQAHQRLMRVARARGRRAAKACRPNRRMHPAESQVLQGRLFEVEHVVQARGRASPPGPASPGGSRRSGPRPAPRGAAGTGARVPGRTRCKGVASVPCGSFGLDDLFHGLVLLHEEVQGLAQGLPDARPWAGSRRSPACAGCSGCAPARPGSPCRRRRRWISSTISERGVPRSRRNGWSFQISSIISAISLTL